MTAPTTPPEGAAGASEPPAEAVAFLAWAYGQQPVQNAISARCPDATVRALVTQLARSAWLAGVAFGKTEGGEQQP